MQDMSRAPFPKITVAGNPWATGSDPRDTAKLFQIDSEAIGNKEVPADEGPVEDSESGDGV